MVVCMKKILLFATFALLNVGLGFAELHETFDGGVFSRGLDDDLQAEYVE